MIEETIIMSDEERMQLHLCPDQRQKMSRNGDLIKTEALGTAWLRQ